MQNEYELFPYMSQIQFFNFLTILLLHHYCWSKLFYLFQALVALFLLSRNRSLCYMRKRLIESVRVLTHQVRVTNTQVLMKTTLPIVSITLGVGISPSKSYHWNYVWIMDGPGTLTYSKFTQENNTVNDTRPVLIERA